MHYPKKQRTIMLIIIIILLSVIAFVIFYRHSREYLRSICNSELADYAIHNVYSTKSELEKAIALTQTSSEAFENVSNLVSESTLHKLDILAYDTPFESMTICATDGKIVNGSGVLKNAANETYFQRTLLGESSITATDITQNGTLDIVTSAPIISEGKVTGTLHGIYNTFDLSKIINVDSFTGDGYAVLINTSGDVIVPCSSAYCLNKENENYWAFFKKVKFTDYCSYRTLQSNIQHEKSGFAYYSLGNEQREMYYTPAGINNWYLLQMVTSDVVTNYTAPMTRMVFYLISAIFLLFLLASIVIYRQMEQNRQEKEIESERFRTLAENIPGGVAEISINDDFMLQYANDGFFELTGYSKEEFTSGWIQGHCMRILYSEDNMALSGRISELLKSDSRTSLEYQIVRKDGAIRWMNLSGNIIRHDADQLLLQALVTDVTLQKQEESRILEKAKLDKMTQLYDKVSSQDIIQNELSLQQSNCTDVLLIVDIDNFKRINDSYGHPLGDTAIIMIADTLKNMFRKSDLKGRIGGDEFIVLLRNISSISVAEQLVSKFQKRIRELELAGSKGELSCSVGGIVVELNQDYKFEEIFRQADQNLYHVKKNGKGHARITAWSPGVTAKEASV